MIIFKKLRFKNFFSTGNSFIEINLNESDKTLIIGKNGAGKSQIMDALCFSLFGRAYRNISKPSLVNSINQKNCLVEIEFSIGTKFYKVERGINPNIFKIYSDGTLIPQDANVRDYQKKLEDIMKMSCKSFSQIVLLGSSNFVPFMQLSKIDRREIIEDLLDIKVFSVMNGLLKSKITDNTIIINQLYTDLNMCEVSITNMKKLLSALKESNKEQIDNLNNEIDKLIIKNEGLEIEILSLENEINSQKSLIVDVDSTKEKHFQYESVHNKLQEKIVKLKKEIKFYEVNDHCPICDQDINSKFKNNMIESKKEEKKKVDKGREKVEDTIEELIERLEEIRKLQDKISRNLKAKESKENERKTTNSLLEAYNNSLKASKENETKKEEIQNQEKEINLQTEILEKKSFLLAKRNKSKVIYDLAVQLLKDNGIKTQIIKQYLPIINKLVNQHLASMDFFVQFELNETFEETIKSRYRDSFTYENFSEGEKLRIDLALLFTWRAVAKLRNSVNTNIMFFDEIFDSSLDSSGTEEFVKLLNKLSEGTNVFLISHKSELEEKFDNILLFEKRNDFSQLIESE